MFQFLIGSLITVDMGLYTIEKAVFQFLIGSLITISRPVFNLYRVLVSIPYR